ncbi:PTS transporter subunit EIIC [Gallaecimonas sp. GXIMD4217]|uniref:PTS transporter subunit EIIC n=1 Tax=Gallaecimonas sp. GXIMD4217 TaxID=3131927 RepID=UPI00311AB9E9
MLPVTVLPAAGLLLGVGAAQLAWLPLELSQLLFATGNMVFDNLGLLFAVGVVVGLSGNDGGAALAAVVAYLIMDTGLAALSPAQQGLDTGAIGGVLVGLMVYWLHARSQRWRPPAFLGFFSGARLLAVLVVPAALAMAAGLALFWPKLSAGISGFSHWAVTENPTLAFSLYGLGERLLLPFGLHHIWNVPFWWETGGACLVEGQYQAGLNEAGQCRLAGGDWIRGEMRRFLAGDPTAGHLAGGYLIKMVGLPMAALAIWRQARPQERRRVGGLMLSGALASMLTGVTEPIEFSFLFVAPLLYLWHCLLSGLAFLLCSLLEVHHGMSFSQGLLDFLLYWPLAHSLAPLAWLIPLYALIYYLSFSLAIRLFRLATPGRGRRLEPAPASERVVADALVAALGGRDNIVRVDACITRLRLQVRDVDMVDKAACRRLGASGVVMIGTGVQLVFGARAAGLKDALAKQL